MSPAIAFACDLRYPKFQENAHFAESLRMCIPPGSVAEVKNYGLPFERQLRDHCAMHAFNNAVHAAGRSDLTLSVDEMISGAAEMSRREEALGAGGAETHSFLMGNWMADAIPLAARLKYGDHRRVAGRESLGRTTRYPSKRTLRYAMSEPGNTHFFAISPRDGGASILLLDSLQVNPLVAPLQVIWEGLARARGFRYVLWEICSYPVQETASERPRAPSALVGVGYIISALLGPWGRPGPGDIDDVDGWGVSFSSYPGSRAWLTLGKQVSLGGRRPGGAVFIGQWVLLYVREERMGGIVQEYARWCVYEDMIYNQACSHRIRRNGEVTFACEDCLIEWVRGRIRSRAALGRRKLVKI